MGVNRGLVRRCTRKALIGGQWWVEVVARNRGLVPVDYALH